MNERQNYDHDDDVVHDGDFKGNKLTCYLL